MPKKTPEERRAYQLEWCKRNPNYRSPSYLNKRKQYEPRLCKQCGVSFKPKAITNCFCSRVCHYKCDLLTNRKHYSAKEKRRYRLRTYGSEYMEIENMTKDRFRAARALGFRSGFENRVATELANCGVSAKYESEKITYTKPEKTHTYTPDFKLPNGIFVETKGRLVTADRQKHLLIKAQHPDLDIRFVFWNSKTRINPGSSTSYADWATKNGFKFADKSVPDEWLREGPRR